MYFLGLLRVSSAVLHPFPHGELFRQVALLSSLWSQYPAEASEMFWVYGLLIGTTSFIRISLFKQNLILNHILVRVYLKRYLPSLNISPMISSSKWNWPVCSTWPNLWIFYLFSQFIRIFCPWESTFRHSFHSSEQKARSHKEGNSCMRQEVASEKTSRGNWYQYGDG